MLVPKYIPDTIDLSNLYKLRDEVINQVQEKLDSLDGLIGPDLYIDYISLVPTPKETYERQNIENKRIRIHMGVCPRLEGVIRGNYVISKRSDRKSNRNSSN